MIINSGVSLISKIGGFVSSNGVEIFVFDFGIKCLFVVVGDVIEILDLVDFINFVKIEDLVLNFDGIFFGFSFVFNSVVVGKVGIFSVGIVVVFLVI